MTDEELLKECQDRFMYSSTAKGLVGAYTDKQLKLIEGRRVGNSHHSGYKYVKIRGKLYPEHRLVFLLLHQRMPHGELDHINLVKDDNRIENLREVSRQHNCSNRETWNSLGYKGVGQNKRGKPFNAQIKFNGKTLWLGSFDDIMDAAKEYDKAAIEYFGNNAKLNFERNINENQTSSVFGWI